MAMTTPRPTRPPRARSLALAGTLAAVLAIAGCASRSDTSSGWFSPYRSDLPQGNYVTREMLDRVQDGMTREQVRAVLGTPLLEDIFRNDRWDYVFRYTHPSGRSELRGVTVFFEQDRVARIKADELPARDDATDPALPGVGRAAGSKP